MKKAKAPKSHREAGGLLRLINYCRVSGQYDEREASLDTQKAANEKAARERGAIIVDTLNEKHTAKFLWERKVLNQVREMIRTGQANGIVVYALDRLIRTQEHLWIIFDEVKRAGGEIVCATEKFEMTSMGKLIMGIYAFKAETERESIRDRTMRGRQSKLSQGRLSGSHGHKFGYRFIVERPPTGKPIHTGLREIYEPEAKVVRMAFKYVLEGLSTRETANRLNDLGYLTRSQSLTRRKQSAKWTTQLVLSLIRERAYRGESVLYYQMDLERNVRIKRDEPFIVPCPVIIEPDDWQRANDNLTNRNSRLKARQEKAWLLFRGLVWCLCGRKCDANRNNRGRHYYVCNSRSNYEAKCGNSSLSQKILDERAWGDVLDFLSNPARTREALHNQQKQDARLESLAQSRADLQARLDNLTPQIERAVGRVLRADPEDIELFEQQLGLLKQERESVKRGIEEIERQLVGIQTLVLDEKMIELARSFLATDLVTDQVKRTILEALQVRVVIGDGDCEVHVPGIGVVPKTSTSTSGIRTRRAESGTSR